MKRVRWITLAACLAVAAAGAWASPGTELSMDEQIKQRVVEQLAWDDRVDASEVTVEVTSGRVTVSGPVTSHFARRAVIEDIWNVDGVVAVDDDLTVEPYEPLDTGDAVASGVRLALSLDNRVDASDISVAAKDGAVTLTGTVDALWEKTVAGRVASDVVGVVTVNNELAVVPTEDVLDEEIARDVVEALDRNITVEVDSIDVSVEDGVVTLTGTVDSWVEHDAAMFAATSTVGVVDVNDELFVDVDMTTVRTDVQITEAVREQLEWDNQVDASDITVQVRDGRVTLMGSVSSQAARRAAHQDALQIAGVTTVRNELVVEPIEPPRSDVLLAEQAANTLEWSAMVEVRDLVVAVNDGVATLEGQVAAFWERREAEELVSGIRGVTDVINKIVVVPEETLLDEVIAEDIVSALDRNALVNVDNVTVEVVDGTVTLLGRVSSFSAREAAYETAANTAGVTSVIDRMYVGS